MGVMKRLNLLKTSGGKYPKKDRRRGWRHAHKSKKKTSTADSLRAVDVQV
jgi:hypothetical protein